MSKAVSDFFVERLHEWGVRRIFGDVLALGRARVDGRGRALRHRREICPSRSAGDRVVGDGAMQMNNMAELITVSKYWQRGTSPKWICCVSNNEDLNQVTWEQRVMEGDPKFEATQDIPDVSYHRFAELIGLRGIFVDDPERLGPAWDEALASDRPTGAAGTFPTSGSATDRSSPLPAESTLR